MVRKKISKIISWQDNKSLKAGLFVIIFAIIGVIVLFSTHAATPNANLEPENGTLSGAVTKFGGDSNTSGGYVKFGQIKKNKSRLGVDINDLPPGITLTQAYDTIASIGFGWVRTGPSFDTYSNTNPNNFDNELAQAKRTNTKVMAVLSYAYGTLGSSGCNNGHCAPKDPAAWAHYAGQLVAHWKSLYPGVVGAVEVWNEANNAQFWNPVNPAAYTDLLKRTYLEIKAVDPNMIVVASGTAPGGGNQSADNTTDPSNPATWYKQLYANGAKGYFDAAGNHPYDTYYLSPNKPATGLRNTFWIRKVMDANGESAKQIWSTEAGVVSCLHGPGSNPPMTEQQRSDRIVGDIQDFWYGVHSQTDGSDSLDGNGKLITSANGDWNAGPYFVFKLYKSTGDSGLGIVYNTNLYMSTGPPYGHPSSEAPSPGGDPEPLCTSSPDYYEPIMANALRYISATPQ